MLVVMMFEDNFFTISAMPWWSLLLLKETWVPDTNHKPCASHWQTLWNKVV